jgi:FkbM family methyltransferase
MSFSIKLGNFLYKHAFVLYKPLYTLFKNKQDQFEIALLKKYIHSGDTVLDIGANIGYYAEILSNIVGEKGIVHCFEPDTTNFEYLKVATNSKENIIINNKAVASNTEKLKIYTSKNLNVDHRTYKPEEYDQEIEIDAVSVDDYLRIRPYDSTSTPLSGHSTPLRLRSVQALSARAQGPNYINFIKMDIQGFEMQALMGMKETLKNNSDVKLISEFWPYGLRKAGSSVSAYYAALANLGFTCYLLEKNTLKKLSLKDVQALEPLGEERYFNIFATRTDV